MIMAEIHESALLKYNFPLYEVSQMHHNANLNQYDRFLETTCARLKKARWCSSISFY
jgi:hypothetical protein